VILHPTLPFLTQASHSCQGELTDVFFFFFVIYVSDVLDSTSSDASGGWSGPSESGSGFNSLARPSLDFGTLNMNDTLVFPTTRRPLQRPAQYAPGVLWLKEDCFGALKLSSAHAKPPISKILCNANGQLDKEAFHLVQRNSKHFCNRLYSLAREWFPPSQTDPAGEKNRTWTWVNKHLGHIIQQGMNKLEEAHPILKLCYDQWKVRRFIQVGFEDGNSALPETQRESRRKGRSRKRPRSNSTASQDGPRAKGSAASVTLLTLFDTCFCA
jgi:hypothetical protein